MGPLEVSVGGHTYAVDKLNAYRQFHVARRLAPAVWALARSAGDVVKAAIPEGVPVTFDNVLKGLKGLEDGALMGAVVAAAGPMVDVFAHMSDADAQYVLDECLSVCSRQVENGEGWQRVHVPGSGLMFNDVTMPEMLQLVVAAVRHNLGNFMPAPATPN